MLDLIRCKSACQEYTKHMSELTVKQMSAHTPERTPEHVPEHFLAFMLNDVSKHRSPYIPCSKKSQNIENVVSTHKSGGVCQDYVNTCALPSSKSPLRVGILEVRHKCVLFFWDSEKALTH